MISAIQPVLRSYPPPRHFSRLQLCAPLAPGHNCLLFSSGPPSRRSSTSPECSAALLYSGAQFCAPPGHSRSLLSSGCFSTPVLFPGTPPGRSFTLLFLQGAVACSSPPGHTYALLYPVFLSSWVMRSSSQPIIYAVQPALNSYLPGAACRSSSLLDARFSSPPRHSLCSSLLSSSQALLRGAVLLLLQGAPLTREPSRWLQASGRSFPPSRCSSRAQLCFPLASGRSALLAP